MLTNGKAIIISGYQLISPGGGFIENAAQNLWTQALATSSQFEVSDGEITALVDTEFVLGNVYDHKQKLQDVILIWQEKLEQVTSQGKMIYY